MPRNTGHGNDSRPATVVKYITQGNFFHNNQSLDVEGQQPSKEPKVKHKQVIKQCRKRQMETNETTQQHRKIAGNPFIEMNSQQKARNICYTQKYPRTKKTDFNVSSKANDEEKSLPERKSYFDDNRTSPDFIESFRKNRTRLRPDPDVYDWPKEWLPKPDTPLVPANTSALRIDPPKSKPPCHVFENTFYLQSPPKMRSEMEPWKLDFDYNPDVEMARIKKIKKAEKQLLHTVSGRRRTHREKLDIKNEAESIVDIEENLEKTAKYNERKKTNMEIMRRVYRERDLGKPPDTNDIREMAMDIKCKVYLKTMKVSHPGYNHTKKSETDHGNMDFDFTIPNEDTITNEARKITNQIFQKTESALERDLGVVIHEPKPRPSAGVNYVYDAYKKERESVLAHNSYSNHGWGTNRIGTDLDTTKANEGQRMTLWYGHENYRKLQQYEKGKHHGIIAGCSSSNSNSTNRKDEEMDGPIDGYDNEESDDGEELEEDIPSPPRMTLWYGHSQSIGDDEDVAIDLMHGAIRKRKLDFDVDGEEEFHSVKHRPTLLYGEHELMVIEEDVVGNDVKLNHNGLGGEKDGATVNDGKKDDAEVSFTRTVPFLYLSTEDLPHRIRIETFTFERTPQQSTNTNDRFLYSPRCVIL
ncbi:uncharacterized protein LOC110450796 [Mizuhopecten yessoensis]|uniref:Uncharacterized protein n=1 Tax=Mizuhopecten yessoensis TaxID=6573 RepID=A0A210QMY0_MIZYE|nr:uncharacterized protein LOC110450796 [Mizuhopecten yessoensis]OWF50092.1 hypothetical protein KP79_PYT14053 [Mizuhopecten yessoensis]